MATAQPSPRETPRRGALARPLDALIFLLPLIVFYEIASFRTEDRVVALKLVRGLIDMFGRSGSWAPALAVIVILLATHVASREPWKVQWKRVLWMYVEAMVLAIPLFVLNETIKLAGAAGSVSGGGLIEELALGVGAGIYEELVFRLLCISLVMMIGVDIMHLDSAHVALAAVLLSSLAFAAAHYQPIGEDTFAAGSFLFRTLAGVYLAAVFWYRGYGPAAGCHAAYNITIAALNS